MTLRRLFVSERSNDTGTTMSRNNSDKSRNSNSEDLTQQRNERSYGCTKSCDEWTTGTPFRLQGTVILHIWWKVLIVVVFSTAVCGLDIFVPMEFTPVLVPILGVVTGFLLVFRTNTAYDRYYEGRKIWSQMTNNVRIITRCVWIAIKETDLDGRSLLVEKKSIINFAVAFPISVKHYLREEYSYDYDDLQGLIGNLKIAKYNANSDRIIKPESSSLNSKSSRRGTRKFTFLCTGEEQPPLTNIPLEIMFSIGIYINSLIQRKICDPSVVRTLNFALNGLGDNLGGFERILTTPIPLAYSIHLHHALWIHLLSLPFQLVSTLKWWTVPAVGFTSFTLLGILAIGWEIENPFGHDYNDLPLDNFCESLRKEVDEIMESKLPTFEDLFLSTPQSNGVNATASDLSKNSIDEVRIVMNTKAGTTNNGFVSSATKL